MTDFRQQYKEKPFGFRGTNEGRLIRAEKCEEARKKQRTTTFNKNRNITDSANNTPQKNANSRGPLVVEDRLTRLMRWKAERDRRKKVETKRKRPPFKVGIVHHKIYSPLNKDEASGTAPIRHKHVAKIEPVSNSNRRVTRATEKRLKAKAAMEKMVTKAPVKNKHAGVCKDQSIEPREKSFAPADHKFKAPVGLPPMPLFGRVTIQSINEQIKSFALSPVKRTSVAEKVGTTEFLVEEMDSQKNESLQDISVQNEDHFTNESSIEAVSLRLSSDEQDPLNSSIEGNVQRRSTGSLNNSKTKVTHTPANVTPTGSTKSGSPSEPVYYSPYIVSSRGKSNARKEEMIRRGLGRSPGDGIPTKETVMKTLNISIEEEERTAQYFHFLLNKEIERLNELCKKWEDIKSEPDVTEDAQYQILQTIGQTNLLINKKFERFRGLVSDCETGKGEMLVTCKDLQGFWDMMYMEIRDCDSRFDKLEKQRAQNWVEEQPIVIKPVVKKKVATKKKVVPAKQSSIRALILAAKKKKMLEMQSNLDDADECKAINKLALSGNGLDDENPTLNNGASPVVKQYTRRSISSGKNEVNHTPAKKESTRMSLLQKVQLSETSKKIRSPLTIMKISKMCKTPEVTLDSTISYVNSDQTPAKSILKRSKDSKDLESSTKSTHKVNFDDNVILNEVAVDKETQTKLNLAAALARIESFDFDSAREQVKINAERKLTYDTDSSDESQDILHDTDQQEEPEMTQLPSVNAKALAIPIVCVESATPLKEISSLNNSPETRRNSLRKRSSMHKDTSMRRRTLQRQNAVDLDSETDDNDESIRTLRNRTVTSRDTPKSKRRSRKVFVNVQDTEQKENKSPLKTRRKSSAKIRVSHDEYSKIDLEHAMDQISLNGNGDKPRRSTRRSVKFTAEDCTGCVEIKPVLPMTPHVRRSRIQSSERRRNTLVEDHSSIDTPGKPPDRVRRSRSKRA